MMTLKIHLFRMIPKDGFIHDTSSSLENKYRLYAFTESKKLAKRFMVERDMKQFIHTTVNKSKEDAEYWMHHNRGMWLRVRNMETCLNKNTPDQIMKHAKVLITENEASFVDEVIDTNPIGPIAEYCGKFLDPDIFDDKLRGALKRLKYDEFWSMMVYASEYCDTGYMAVEDTPDITFDWLGMFTLMYGDILSTKFYDNVEIVDKP